MNDAQTFLNSCRKGELDIVSAYFTVNKIDPSDTLFQKGLLFAGGNRHLKVVELFIDNQVPFELEDNDARNLFFNAIMRDNLTIVQYILNSGFNLNTLSDEMTPLMEAANSESINSAKLLISLGVDVNEKANDNTTALHHAIFHACESFISPEDDEMVSLLIKTGADINVIDDMGQSPLSLAENYAQNEGGVDYTGILKEG